LKATQIHKYAKGYIQQMSLLHFTQDVANAKCILVIGVCVCLSLATFPLLHGPGCNLGEW